MVDYSHFSYSKWAESSREGRLNMLSELEAANAYSQSREACSVRADERLTDADFGAYEGKIDGHESMAINPTLLNVSSYYDAMDTVIHEGRHSMQTQAVSNPDAFRGIFSDEQIKSFAANSRSENYQCDGQAIMDGDNKAYADYLAQPLESDAREYAREQIEHLHEANAQQNQQYNADENSLYDNYNMECTEREQSINAYAETMGMTADEYKSSSQQSMMDSENQHQAMYQSNEQADDYNNNSYSYSYDEDNTNSQSDTTHVKTYSGYDTAMVDSAQQQSQNKADYQQFKDSAQEQFSDITDNQNLSNDEKMQMLNELKANTLAEHETFARNHDFADSYNKDEYSSDYSDRSDLGEEDIQSQQMENADSKSDKSSLFDTDEDADCM